VIESSWDKPASDDVRVNQNAFSASCFPEVNRVAASSGLSVRIFKAQRPDSFEVVA
jgi:hypothetical protein